VAPLPPCRGPTRRQLEVLRAYIAAGSIAAAAYELGISETTARQHLSGLYRRTGCRNAAQAAYWLGAVQLDRHPIAHLGLARADRGVIGQSGHSDVTGSGGGRNSPSMK
jgi:DNA-binding CsgD family transcriptional regulator